MTHIDIHIKTNNAAFQAQGSNVEGYAPGHETARILREVADTIEADVPLGLTLSDYNGNKVGTLTHKKDDQAPSHSHEYTLLLQAQIEELEKENRQMKEKLAQAYFDLSKLIL